MGLTRDHRRSLLDQIDPGDRRLKAGLILTYSADAAPIVAVLSTLAGHPLSGEEAVVQGLQNGFRIMRDIEALSDRVRILVNVGGFRASGARMAALLDTVVREVVPKNSECSFHPKLLIFSYEPEDKTQTAVASDIRMFVCTRNVTTDDSVDAIVSLRLTARDSVTANGKRLRSFLQAALSEIPEDSPVEVTNLLEHIEKAELEPLYMTSSIKQIEFYGQIPGRETLSSLISRSDHGVDERIVVSPFLDKTTLSAFVLGKGRKTSLLSERRDFVKICALHEGSNFLKENFDCYEINHDGDQSFHSLHAKLVLDRTASETAVTVGSANASLRAWTGANWEAVIRFRTTPNYYNAVFNDLFVSSETENRAALCVPFRPVSETPMAESPEDVVSTLISRASLEGTVAELDGSSVSVHVGVTPAESKYEIRSVSFRLLGEVEEHEASLDKQTWRLSWSVPIARFSAILSVAATFAAPGGEARILVNRFLNVDPALLLLRNRGLLSELVQTQGIHEILSAILEGAGFGFSENFGSDAGASWALRDGAEFPVASLEALVFLCLKNDPDSLAKRSMISDVMRAEYTALPVGVDAERISRHRRLFESVKKIWTNLNSEFPTKAG